MQYYELFLKNNKDYLNTYEEPKNLELLIKNLIYSNNFKKLNF